MKTNKMAKVALRKDHQNEVARLRRILREKGAYTYPMRRRHAALRRKGVKNEEN